MNPSIRDILTKLLVPHAGRYSSRSYRRGEAQALQSKGPQWPTVATIGDWRSLACKGYVDLANEVARDLPQLLIADMSLGKDGEGDI